MGRGERHPATGRFRMVGPVRPAGAVAAGGKAEWKALSGRGDHGDCRGTAAVVEVNPGR